MVSTSLARLAAACAALQAAAGLSTSDASYTTTVDIWEAHNNGNPQYYEITFDGVIAANNGQAPPVNTIDLSNGNCNAVTLPGTVTPLGYVAAVNGGCNWENGGDYGYGTSGVGFYVDATCKTLKSMADDVATTFTNGYWNPGSGTQQPATIQLAYAPTHRANFSFDGSVANTFAFRVNCNSVAAGGSVAGIVAFAVILAVGAAGLVAFWQWKDRKFRRAAAAEVQNAAASVAAEVERAQGKGAGLSLGGSAAGTGYQTLSGH